MICILITRLIAYEDFVESVRYGNVYYFILFYDCLKIYLYIVTNCEKLW